MKFFLPVLLAGCLALSGCQGNPSNEAATASASPSAVVSPQEQDKATLYEKYMRSVFIAGIADKTWDKAEDVSPDVLLMFYSLESLQKEFPAGWKSKDIPADKAEAFIKTYFDVSSEHLREGERYQADSLTYRFGYGIGMATEMTITKSELTQNRLVIWFEIKDSFDEVLRKGQMEIDVAEHGYKYVSCQCEIVPAGYEAHRGEFGIDDAPVDLNIVGAVTQVYVSPLIPSGPLWMESWSSPMEVGADNLIHFCSYNNFLNLPRDFEMCYADEDSDAPQEAVEAAIQKHFDVDVAYIRTSSLYDVQKGTYRLSGGFGGGGGMTALSAKQDGNIITIEIGRGTQEMPGIIPEGRLTVRLEEGNVVKYVSYQLNEPLPD